VEHKKNCLLIKHILLAVAMNAWQIKTGSASRSVLSMNLTIKFKKFLTIRIVL